ncbi:hypothetical protein Malapachy_3676 [Malassezia pachydermatis]|uniref:Uncharacterized protein n=1 Tax=Malassezia pachydermatis TaxID=77020 RepID=A0A0M8MY65_9BASI|nr:hypothetical protein Malapachy_3676 [Malassezia pachydermatis]KOS15921.1 hypothetical protein Malapachy_3676 [Malassezia pachydermatis]
MTATWREFFSYSKYTTVVTRAVRASLKEAERVDADRRAFQALRYQEWKNGQSSEHINLAPKEK